MKKRYFPILLLFIINNVLAQGGTKALELAKIVHAKQIENSFGFIQGRRDLETLDRATTIGNTAMDSLYQQLTTVYNELFIEEDIMAMLLFYKSPSGRKMLETQQRLDQRASKIIFNWEMEQQGIVIQEPMLPFIGDELHYLEQQQKEPQENTPTKEAIFPKINTLEDLKKILLKDPNMVSDHKLLEELLGEKEFKKAIGRELQLSEFN